MRVLVCGGRDFSDRSAINAALNEIHTVQGPIRAVIDGLARGADALGSEWAQQNGVCNIRVPANWRHHGTKAGPIRNGWMLEHCQPDLVGAFPGGKGTANMVKQARMAGVRVSEPLHSKRGE